MWKSCGRQNPENVGASRVTADQARARRFISIATLLIPAFRALPAFRARQPPLRAGAYDLDHLVRAYTFQAKKIVSQKQSARIILTKIQRVLHELVFCTVESTCCKGFNCGNAKSANHISLTFFAFLLHWNWFQANFKGFPKYTLRESNKHGSVRRLPK